MGAIAAGGKKITFTKRGATVTSKSTGKTTTYKKSGGSYIRTSSSKSSSSSSSSGSRASAGQTIVNVATITDAKTGKVVQQGGSYVVSSTAGKTISGGSPTASVSLTNTKTGKTTIDNVNLKTGKIISSKVRNGITDSQKQLVYKNYLSAPQKQTLFGKAREYTTPSTRDIGLVKGLKAVGSTALDIGEGTYFLGKTILKAATGDKAASNQLKQSFTLNALKESVSQIGTQLQSGDVFERTKGLLSLGTLVTPVKIPALKALPKVNKITYKTTSSLVKDSVKTTIVETGEIGTKTYKATTTLRKTKEGVVGNTVTEVGTKTYKQTHSLKDAGGYYVDKKTGKTVNKSNIDATDVTYNIKEIKQSKTTKDRNLIIDGVGVSVGKRSISITTTKGILKNGKIVQEVSKTKSSVFDFSRDTTGKIKDAVSFKQSLSAKLTKKKIPNKVKDLSDFQIQRFLKAINYDRELIRGLDRRTRMARALGLRKTSPTLKKFELYFEKEFPTIVQKTGKITATAEKELNRLKKTYSQRWGKKARLLDKTKPLSKKEVNIVKKVGKKIEIPELRSRIALTKSLRIKGLIPVRTAKDLIKGFEKGIDKLKKQPPIKVPLKKVPLKIPQRKIPVKKKIPTKITPKKKLTTPSQIPKTIPPKTPKIPRLPPKETIIPPKKLKYKLSIDSKQLDNKILTFEGVYRERKNPNKPLSKSNPIVTKRINIRDTKNRALKRVANKVDNNAPRSMTLKLKGIGKYKKDISKPSNLKKFSLKKSVNTPVLKLVEKSKYAIDTRGEKKSLKSKRLINKKKQKISIKRSKK